ncbi:MAG: hypothetical protein DA446_05805 [Bacteroidetes bacterium]|jgi:hypothetical protein|nr:MAG: hypothetical protein DA443_03570 [Bacteroidota bacterium]PTM19962.1 MAG: hypothetical protein DA446_05805 [Bacteroidota bacterium]
MKQAIFIPFIAFLIAFLMSTFNFRVMAQDMPEAPAKETKEVKQEMEDALIDTVTALSEPVASTDSYDMYGSVVETWENATGITGLDTFNAEAEAAAPVQHLFKGEVTQVCQSKGCNLWLTDGEQQVRIRFKDYAFFVPTNSAGKEAVVRGHYMEKEQEEGDPVIEFLADGIVLFK